MERVWLVVPSGRGFELTRCCWLVCRPSRVSGWHFSSSLFWELLAEFSFPLNLAFSFREKELGELSSVNLARESAVPVVMPVWIS